MSWLFSSKKSSKAASPSEPHSGPQRKPAREIGTPGSGSAKRKSERSGRRELLYAVVREAMVRAGVLSASYKFKVLSLDSEGRQFLIMVDLSRGSGGDAANLAEIEALIAQSAKSRHEILVTAVYWRMNEHVSIGRADLRHHARATDSQPPAPDSQPTVLHTVLEPSIPPTARGPVYDPIEADEVEAFKRALDAGSRPAPLMPTPDGTPGAGGKGHAGPRSYTLLTGYEDTELPESEPKPLLSGTQYGEMR